jgi:hypothetical protein
MSFPDFYFLTNKAWSHNPRDSWSGFRATLTGMLKVKKIK